MFLYITADRIGVQTGGGTVTHHERRALRERAAGEVTTVSIDHDRPPSDPFAQDAEILARVRQAVGEAPPESRPGLAHCYAGCLTETVGYLKARGFIVTYTAAAHDIGASRKAHEELGLPYDYPHLTDPAILDRYLGGYRLADIVVCPSRHAATVMRRFGCRRVEVVPHGVDLPGRVVPPPQRFRVGYLGAVGPDKGLVDLLQAWNRLNRFYPDAYRDATLALAGRDSTSDWVRHLTRTFGGGAVELLGWVEDVSDFYSGISLYVQPSRSEGFGIEVLEALAHGRFVVCSDGAGAADVIGMAGIAYAAGDVTELARAIYASRDLPDKEAKGDLAHYIAGQYTWDKIRLRYAYLWSELLR